MISQGAYTLVTDAHKMIDIFIFFFKRHNGLIMQEIHCVLMIFYELIHGQHLHVFEHDLIFFVKELIQNSNVLLSLNIVFPQAPCSRRSWPASRALLVLVL